MAGRGAVGGVVLGTVEVHEGVEVSARAVERVAVAAAREVAGVTSLEPTLLGVAAGMGRQVLDKVTGRTAAGSGDGMTVSVDDGVVRIEVCLSLGGRSAREVCAEVSRAVREQVRAQLGVVVASVRTVVVDVAALPVTEAPAAEDEPVPA